MQSTNSLNSEIYFDVNAYKKLEALVSTENYSKIFIFVDENTQIHCLKQFEKKNKLEDKFTLIVMPSGEEHKTISTCLKVWQKLSEEDADKKSLLINLGGGVVTDLGGFIASTFKRGIPFVNVPTSLLAMVDASIGGKTGVDFGNLKNQIGVVNLPELVIIDTEFLKTLPENHYNSGLAEMLKHGLIYNEKYWHQMTSFVAENIGDLDTLIYESITIKDKIVTQDPLENGLRKTLNYGHTLGHAIESLYLKQSESKTLLHGEAIAIGMILETYLSYKILDFPEEKLHNIKKAIQNLFGKVIIEKANFMAIIELLKFDKKNTYGNVNFVLLNNIGQTLLDCKVDNALILEAFEYNNQ